MSSKRGRKRNDNLPPNRARDVQRAFRARRAAHLQALEQRVYELEEENTYFRQALNLPPSERLPLGKGPTGKDKAKNMDRSRMLSFASSCESSVADSPSPHSSENSPSMLTVSMSPRSMSLVESSPAWNGPLILDDHSAHMSQDRRSPPLCSPEGPYRSTPLLAPHPMKSMTPAPYHTSPSRNIPPDMYAPTATPTSYSPTSERSIERNFDARDIGMHGPSDLRDDLPRQLYHPSSQPFHIQDPTLHTEELSDTASASQPQYGAHAQQMPLYQRPTEYAQPQRMRSLTDPQGFSVGNRYPRVPDLQQPHHQNRPAEYPRPNEPLHLPNTLRSPHYGPDGRLQQLLV